MAKTIRRNSDRNRNSIKRGRRLRGSELRELERLYEHPLGWLVDWAGNDFQKEN